MSIYEGLKKALEQAIEYENGNTDNVIVKLLALCPNCGKVAGFNSHFQAYYCTSCGNLFNTGDLT